MYGVLITTRFDVPDEVSTGLNLNYTARRERVLLTDNLDRIQSQRY